MAEYKVRYRIWNEYETVIEDCNSREEAESDVRANYFEIDNSPVDGNLEIVDVEMVRPVDLVEE